MLQIDPEYVSQAQWMFGLVLLMPITNLIGGPFSVGLYVRQRFVLRNVYDLVAEVLRIVLLAALLFLVSTSVTWLVVASLTALLFRTLIGIVYTVRLVPAVRLRASAYCSQTARRLISFGAWTGLGGVVQVISGTAPILLLNSYGTAVDLTCFHLGRLPDVQIRKVLTAALAPVQPVLTSLYAREGSAALHELYFRGNRYILWLALLGTPPLTVFAVPITEAYVGATYTDAAYVMMLLLGCYPLVFASTMFHPLAHASGRISSFYLNEIVIQAVTLIALCVTVIHFKLGAWGAAIAIGGSVGILHVLVTWTLGLRMVGKSWWEFVRQTLLPGLLPFGLAMAACLSFQTLFDPASWLMLGIGSLGSVAIYLAAIWFFSLSDEDRALADQGIDRIRSILNTRRSRRQATTAFEGSPTQRIPPAD